MIRGSSVLLLPVLFFLMITFSTGTVITDTGTNAKSSGVINSVVDSRTLKTGNSSITTPFTSRIISIMNESDLQQLVVNENWPGSGTGDDPFIIEGYNLTTIQVSNVYSHVMIRNSTVMYDETHGDPSVLLKRVANIQFENNTALHSAFYLDECSNVSFAGNDFYSSDGVALIWVRNSIHMTFKHNKLGSSNAAVLDLRFSSSVTVEDNIITYGSELSPGIRGLSCSSLILANNTLIGSNIRVYTCHYLEIRNNTVDHEIWLETVDKAEIINNSCEWIEIAVVKSLILQNNTVEGIIFMRLVDIASVTGNSAEDISVEYTPNLTTGDNVVKTTTASGLQLVAALAGMTLLVSAKKRRKKTKHPRS
ncbi:MAG: right-handed parallel beta-helix repeat-containing protein [Candidatus Odinarchaeota archaeon]